MYLICCVDDRMGMTFGKRRVSRDRLLVSDMISLIEEKTVGKLVMESYSAELFAEEENLPEIVTAEKPLEVAGVSDYCFDERFAPAGYAAEIEKIVLYRWNRAYPATVHFDIDLDDGQWIKEESEDFCGNSHDKITREIWRRKQ